MKKMFFGLVALLLVSGCSLAISPVVNTVDLTSRDFSNANSLKKGKSCAITFLNFLGPFGDIQVINAVKAANIKKVYTVDYQNVNYLIAAESCVVVYGE